MSFDRVAAPYQVLETLAFGQALQRARASWISQIKAPERTLIVGEGNGRFLCQLLLQHPGMEVDCLDASERMLQLALARVERVAPQYQSKIRFLHQDITRWWPEPVRYDLIVTHFFLDCFTEREVEEIVARLARAAKRDAVWLLADFCVPPGRIRKAHARAWLWSMYRFFRVTAGISGRTLVDPSLCLREQGFRCENRRNSRLGLVKSELWRRC